MIRVAKIEDIVSITEIYNQAIDARFQTAFTERVTIEERTVWFNGHTEGAYPVFVYVIDEKVVGWVSISPYRSGRAALRFCVEISYFVHQDHQRKGIGSQVLEHAVKACRDLHYRAVLAIILDKNESSIRLIEKAGFEKWGYLPGVADFDGVVCGHVYYGNTIVR